MSLPSPMSGLSPCPAAGRDRRPVLHILHLEPLPIFDQLAVEEALFRADTENWCLINHGTPPAIVMGMSGRAEEAVEEGCQIPIIRRFSGGGTVVVDEGTVFFTLILNHADLPCAPTPADVMSWTGRLLAPAFAPYALEIEEQDYVIEGKKIGGNAQSFSSRRVVHHTSLLWTWQQERMALLKMPRHRPAYRGDRSHQEFCNSLCRYFCRREALIAALERAVGAAFACTPGCRDQVISALATPHRKALCREDEL